MTVELVNRGHEANHRRVERLMRAHGIVGVHKPAKVRTTIPAESPGQQVQRCGCELGPDGVVDNTVEREVGSSAGFELITGGGWCCVGNVGLGWEDGGGDGVGDEPEHGDQG